MNGLELFQFGSWSVRVVEQDGEAWFVATDVCEALGYVNGPAAVGQHVHDDDRNTIAVHDGIRGNPNKLVVNESGLYALIFGSKLPKAVEFKRWVTRDVIPSIRRTGGYQVAPQFEIPQTYAAALQLAANQAAELEAKNAELEAARPMVEMAEHLIDAAGDYSVRDAAQALSRDHGIDTGQNRLFVVLRQLKWLDAKSVPYQSQIDNGRLAVRLTTYDDPYTGEPKVKTQVRVTAKGILALRDALRPRPGLTVVEGGAS